MVRVFLFCLLADEGAERDDDLSGDADEVKVPEVCAEAQRGHVYGEEHRPHHYRNNDEVEAAVMPYRIEHQPDDRANGRGVDQREVMRGAVRRQIQYDKYD